MEVNTIRTPKSFYVQERRTVYSEAASAIWRELFQNSVDAGAERIDITIQNGQGKGSFGRRRTAKDVVRIVFADDGCGMTEDIIDNVFFRPGESTKRGDANSTGGFGRARLLTAYSQARYSLLTGRRAVEGDGPEYVHRDVDEMIAGLRSMADELANEAPDDERIMELRAEADLLQGLADKGPYKGLRFEVDLDVNEDPERYWNNPSLDKMMNALNDYLRMSQVPCKVFVNGEERKERLLRGPVKRTLFATGPDGVLREFATVHTSKGDKAAFKQQILVRVDGATMYATSIDTDVQVIVELDKAMAREILTANRDGIREPYATAFESLRSEINIDVRSALDDNKLKDTTIKGTLGQMTAKRADIRVNISASIGQEREVIDDEVKAAAAARRLSHMASSSTGPSELELEGFGGIPFHVLDRFFSSISYNNTFLNEWDHGDLYGRLRDATASGSSVQRVRKGLESMRPEEIELVVGTLLERIEATRREAEAEMASRLQGMPDIRIGVEGEVTGKVRDAMRRNDPALWDPATGRGQRQRSTLAAWTVLCKEAIQTVMDNRPNVFPESFSWTTGFLYAAPQETYRFKQSFEAYTTSACHQKEGDNHYLLLNPVDSNGVLKYNPREPADMQRLAMLAAHEVAHIAFKYHDEDFADLMTFIAMNMDMKQAFQSARAALDQVRDIYKQGRVNSQAMDDEKGIRPSDRLMANAAPLLTAAAGVMASPENRHLPSATLAALDATSIRHPDGSVETDCERLQEMENAAHSAFERTPEAELEYGPTP